MGRTLKRLNTILNHGQCQLFSQMRTPELCLKQAEVCDCLKLTNPNIHYLKQHHSVSKRSQSSNGVPPGSTSKTFKRKPKNTNPTSSKLSVTLIRMVEVSRLGIKMWTILDQINSKMPVCQKPQRKPTSALPLQHLRNRCPDRTPAPTAGSYSHPPRTNPSFLTRSTRRSSHLLYLYSQSSPLIL